MEDPRYHLTASEREELRQHIDREGVTVIGAKVRVFALKTLLRLAAGVKARAGSVLLARTWLRDVRSLNETPRPEGDST